MDKYVDNIITNLVRDTKIDFERFTTTYPGFLHTFFKYCTDTYGLTVDVIKYVWDHYREVIKDKINKPKQ